MKDKHFFNNLSSTYADIRKLDVKKINLKGKNILEYIKESSTIILDERGTKADDTLDIWNSYVTKDVNGNVIINRDAKPHVHSVEMNRALKGITKSQYNTLKTAVKVIDDEVLDTDDAHLMYWQTNGLTHGYEMFSNCSKLTTFNSDLSSLMDGHDMFGDCSQLTSFSSDLSSLKYGDYMFSYCPFTSFSSELPSLTNGDGMFYNCNKLTSFNSDLSNVTSCNSMFYGCSALTSFTSDLSSLTNGRHMFYCCNALTPFSSDLSSLTHGNYMFNYCTSLESFSSDLSSLTTGYNMFANCSSLTSFSSDLSSLTDGEYMFTLCTNLTSFSSNLSSLTHGEAMFSGCILDAQSVANIIHFIPQRDAKPTSMYNDGIIYIGVGITNTDAAKQAFAEECDCDNWEGVNKEFDDKNWAVEWQFNGSASSPSPPPFAPFDLRGERPSTAVFARLEEVIMPTEEEITEAQEKGEHIEIPSYEYTSQDGTKFYNIHWYHDSNTNNDGYDYFESLEEAISAYSVISKA